MIDFLKKINISDETIELIKKNNSENQLYNLYCNQDECIKIINYFDKIGVKKINELLINEIQVFYKIASDIINKFSPYNIEQLVEIIN